MIRLAKFTDISFILEIIKDAVNFLKEHNIPQWQNNYPNEDVIKADINRQTLYLYWLDNKAIGMINIALAKDPQYDLIYQGAWLNNLPYATIHRLAIKKRIFK